MAKTVGVRRRRMKEPDPIEIGGLIVALSPLAWALIYVWSKL